VFHVSIWGVLKLSLGGLSPLKSPRGDGTDRNLIFYSFSRLIAIVANTNAHIYAREE